MADIDFKTADLDATIDIETALIFGADSQSDTLPAPRSLSVVADALRQRTEVVQNKTIDDTNTIDVAAVSGLAPVATTGAYGDLSGTPTISGSNTGDQLTFKTIAVSGQSDVVADSTTDTLTLVAGANITLTTNAAADTITIASSGGGGGGGLSDGDYGDVVVSGTGTVMTIDSAYTSALVPLTTRGDLLTRGAAANARLALGTSGYHVQSDGTDAVWAGFVQAGTGAATRTWQTKLRETLTPDDFGCIGDGSTNDTTNFLAALTAANAAGKAVELRSDATYLLSSWTAYTNSNPIRIIGNGATLKGPVTTVKFLAPDAAFDIDKVVFDRWSGAVERLTAASASFSGCRFTRNKCTNFDGGCFNMERPFADSYVDDNIFISNTGAYAIRVGENTVGNQDNWARFSVSGNVIDGMTGSSSLSTFGILVYGRDATINRNKVKGVSGNSGEGWGIYTKLRYSTVSNNIIRDIKSTSSSDVVGISMKGAIRGDSANGVNAYQNVVFGNTVFDVGVLGTKGVGIRVQTSDVTVIGNVVEDTGLTGILVDQVSGNDVSIVSNKIYFSSTPSTNGVYLNGSGSRFQLLNNNIKNTNQSVYLNGSGTLASVDVIGNVCTPASSGIVYNVAFNVSGLKIINNIVGTGSNGIVNNGGAGVLSSIIISNNDLSACATQLNGQTLTKVVSNLPSASAVTAGTRDFVSDASAPTFGSTVSGGGAVKVPVYSDGSAWKVG